MASAASLNAALAFRGPEPRILIVRTSALGDLVFATALLAGLRERWPEAHIAWLAQPGFGAILQGDPRLDEIVHVPADALESPRALWRLRGELRARRFDWVLDAQGLAKSRVLAALAGGATRIGFESKEPLAFLLDHRLPKGGDIRDIASEYRYMAEAITGRAAPPPSLIVANTARAAATDALRVHGLEPGFVALCPFTTRPQKHWMADYWPELVAQLDRPCVIFGGPGDVIAAERIVAASKVPIVNLAGRTRLDEVAAWLGQAGVVIGVDTGLTHIGIAVQRPVVALFGSTCPYTRIGGAGAHAPLTVMYDALPCSPCRRSPTCDGRFDCMRAITPLRVAAAARELLACAA